MDAFKEEYSIDEWLNISSEFLRIKEHYLDHAGATLYSERQIQEAYRDLSQNVYSNPHTSKSTEDLIDHVRSRILDHFNTDSSAYNVIFTSGTTASLKIVAESFDFSGENSQFCYLRDSHTSVLGMRELVGCAKISSIEKCELLSIAKSTSNHLPKVNDSKSLLVFPAQCNFNGFKYPLEIIERFHSSSFPENFGGSEWYICLDAASFVATNHLNLGLYNPDFICMSFYKIFGYPTGLGALLVNKRAEHVLKKRYYGGGTVKIAMSQINYHEKRDSLHERFEDGTISFLSILSLLHGFDTLQRLVPNYKNGMKTMERISRHTFNLAKYLRNRLAAIKHSSGKDVVILYADTDYNSNKLQGGIVNFNVLHSDGSFVGFAEFSYMAAIFNITVRTGCFCNLGACQRHLELSNRLVKEQYQAGHICGDSNDLINGIPTGSIRASVGYMTGLANVNALINMIEKCYSRESRILDINSITEVYKTSPQAKSENITIKMICIYPIKSCGAFKIYDEWPVTSYGLQYDRGWMIITEKGIALTQKINTMMCLIKPHIDKILEKMTLFFPGMESISLSLNTEDNNENNTIQDLSLCKSKVCGDQIKGYDCGNEVAKWLERALGLPGVRLIRKCSTEKRFYRQNKTKTISPEISLVNQAQFLLINSMSVSWLMDKVSEWEYEENRNELELGVVDRFRGNIVIHSSRYLEEANWKMIKIGPILFKVEGQCTRCQMICIDQHTGQKTTEPLRTIAKEFKGKMKFGIYLSLANIFTNTILSCNDSIQIITTEEHNL